VALFAVLLESTWAADVNECTIACESKKRDVLTMEMCRDAKKVLPRPKVGDFCTMAMEQAYSDVCMDYCMGKIPVSRLAQTCRAASMEMPRPTVRRWCEHGYTEAFKASKRVLATVFVQEGASGIGDSEASGAAVADAADAEEPRRLAATIPITLDDKVVDLHLYEGDSAEDSVVTFCHKHLNDDIAGCIRELLPTVLERLDESIKSRGADSKPEPTPNADASVAGASGASP
jgi:hypothetical protein